MSKAIEPGLTVRVKNGTCEGWIGKVLGRCSDNPKLFALYFGARGDDQNGVAWFPVTDLEAV